MPYEHGAAAETERTNMPLEAPKVEISRVRVAWGFRVPGLVGSTCSRLCPEIELELVSNLNKSRLSGSHVARCMRRLFRILFGSLPGIVQSTVLVC